MEIKREDLRGLHVGENELLCMDCFNDEDLENPEQILSADQVEKKTNDGTFIFCDKCKKRIKA